MQLIRDVILAILLVIGLLVATLPTIAVLIVAFALTLLPGGSKQHRSVGLKVAFGTIAVILVIVVVALWLVLKVLGAAGGSAVPHLGPVATTVAAVTVSVIFAVAAALTVLIYTYNKYRILSEHLRPGAEAFRFEASAPRIESRIAEVEAAQWGNVALYSRQNPFVGAGQRTRAWSIAIELDRAHPSARDNWLKPESPGYVPIDPVELRDIIRDRLLRLKDPALPSNERISALTVEDHIVGEGQRRWDGPLVDPVRNVPYSQASPEAIEALIRHPQAGLRYYQRVTVNDEGQAVLSDGQQVIGRADQEIAVSVFVYVAVEGRMFYVEFVSTALPPVLRKYHVINLLTRMSPGRFLTVVVMDAARAFFGYILASPFMVFGTLRLMHRERKSAEEEVTSVTDYLQDDVGARFSVRELGASSSMHTFIQDLDAGKYTKIIERLLNDTVLDFLAAKGVDTTAYRASANVAINNGTILQAEEMSNVNVGGHGNTFTTHQAAAAPQQGPATAG